MRGPVIASERERWAAWATASVGAHAIILAAILVSVPSELVSQRGPVVMPVQLLPVSPLRTTSRPVPLPTAAPRIPATKRAVSKRHLRRSISPAHTGLRSEPGHARRQAARAKAVRVRPQSTIVRTTASSPADITNVSAHDLDLVRRHLERFKFYPENARRRGIGGNVDIGFRLTHGGRVVQVRIAASSGYALLDRAAEAIVVRAVPFPVDSGHYRVRLRFWP